MVAAFTLLRRRAAPALALILVGCAGPGGAAPAARSAPPRAAAAPVDEAPDWPPLPRCSYPIDATTLDVDVEGSPGFAVRARGVHAYPQPEGGRLRARVEGPLQFEGALTPVSMALARPIELTDFGSLPAGTRLSRLRIADEQLEVRAQVTYHPPVEPMTIPQSHATWIALPPQPCDALVYFDQVESPDEVAPAGEVRFGPVETLLRAAPGSERALRLGSRRGVPLLVRETRGDWSRVEVASSFGVSVGGWVRRDALVDEPREAEGGDSVFTVLADPPAAVGRTGTARVRAGAPVHAAPRGPRWATIGEAATFEVRELEPGAEWIVIESAPNARVVGWTGDDELGVWRAWVRRGDVTRLALDALRDEP